MSFPIGQTGTWKWKGNPTLNQGWLNIGSNVFMINGVTTSPYTEQGWASQADFLTQFASAFFIDDDTTPTDYLNLPKGFSITSLTLNSETKPEPNGYFRQPDNTVVAITGLHLNPGSFTTGQSIPVWTLTSVFNGVGGVTLADENNPQLQQSLTPIWSSDFAREIGLFAICLRAPEADSNIIRESGPPLYGIFIEGTYEIIEVTNIDYTMTGGSDSGGTAELIFISDPSGIYTLVPGKTHDTLYNRPSGSAVESIDVKIPDPFAITAFFGN